VAPHADFIPHLPFTIADFATVSDDINTPAFLYSSIAQMGRTFLVCDGTWDILMAPNAGGSSIYSEALSFEFLHRVVGATDVLSEMALEYAFSSSARTDFGCAIAGQRYGVSVTRAIKFMGPFTAVDAHKLLTKKLDGILRSSENGSLGGGGG
jgi:hypothetical protein